MVVRLAVLLQLTILSHFSFFIVYTYEILCMHFFMLCVLFITPAVLSGPYSPCDGEQQELMAATSVAAGEWQELTEATSAGVE